MPTPFRLHETRHLLVHFKHTNSCADLVRWPPTKHETRHSMSQQVHHFQQKLATSTTRSSENAVPGTRVLFTGLVLNSWDVQKKRLKRFPYGFHPSIWSSYVQLTRPQALLVTRNKGFFALQEKKDGDGDGFLNVFDHDSESSKLKQKTSKHHPEDIFQPLGVFEPHHNFEDAIDVLKKLGDIICSWEPRSGTKNCRYPFGFAEHFMESRCRLQRCRNNTAFCLVIHWYDNAQHAQRVATYSISVSIHHKVMIVQLVSATILWCFLHSFKHLHKKPSSFCFPSWHQTHRFVSPRKNCRRQDDEHGMASIQHGKGLSGEMILRYLKLPGQKSKEQSIKKQSVLCSMSRCRSAEVVTPKTSSFLRAGHAAAHAAAPAAHWLARDAGDAHAQPHGHVHVSRHPLGCSVAPALGLATS